MSPGCTVTPPSSFSMTRSGALSTNVQVGSLAVPVFGSSVTTGMKLLPETVPWLQTSVTPPGNGSSTVTSKVMATIWPGFNVSRVTLTISPLAVAVSAARPDTAIPASRPPSSPATAAMAVTSTS